MIEYRFLSAPSAAQLSQLTTLYRHQGWWPLEAADDPEHLKALVAGSHCFVVALHADRVIGMGRAISDGASDAYIQDLAVDTGYRRRGIGTAIIERLIRRLHADGLRWIGLIAEQGSTEFYKTVGFREMPNARPMLLPQK